MPNSTEDQCLDADASRARYDELLTQVLQTDYPGATVTIKYQSVYQTRIALDAMPGPWDGESEGPWLEYEQVKAQIQRRYEEVFEGKHGDWAVENV